MLSNEVANVSSGRSAMIVHTVSTSLHVNMSQVVMTFIVRKSAHITAYFILGILMFNVIKDFKLNAKHAVLVSVALSFLYAVTDEFHQLFVQGRSCELRDVMIDTVASVVGVCLYCLFCRLLICKNNKINV